MSTALWHQQRSFQIVTTASLILRWWLLWRPFQLAQLCVVIKSSCWERRFFDLNLANPAVANVRQEMCKMLRVYVRLYHLQWTKEQVTLYCSDCSSSSEVFLTSSECFMGVAQGNASISVTAASVFRISAFQLSQRRLTKIKFVLCQEMIEIRRCRTMEPCRSVFPLQKPPASQRLEHHGLLSSMWPCCLLGVHIDFVLAWVILSDPYSLQPKFWALQGVDLDGLSTTTLPFGALA